MIIYAHPTLARDPQKVREVEQRIGYRAFPVGRVVKLVPTAKQQARVLLAQRQPSFTPDGAA